MEPEVEKNEELIKLKAEADDLELSLRHKNREIKDKIHQIRCDFYEVESFPDYKKIRKSDFYENKSFINYEKICKSNLSKLSISQLEFLVYKIFGIDATVGSSFGYDYVLSRTTYN